MFTTLQLHGGTDDKMDATISWRWHTVVVCRGWHVQKNEQGQWSMMARVVRADPFKLQQAGTELRFNVPRQGGHWSWPVRAVTVTDSQLTAALGPMEC
jgi:hypothetical protein